MKKVGLISDTHGTFSKELKDFLSDVDVVLHCGDWGSVHTLEEVKAFKPVIGVYGNCDDQDIRMEVPLYQSFKLEDLDCLMIHIGGYPGRYDYKAFQLIEQLKPDMFFCGHSHILKVMNDPHYTKQENVQETAGDNPAEMGTIRKMLVMNPGACGIMGPHNVRTALRFKVEGRQISDLELWQKPR